MQEQDSNRFNMKIVELCTSSGWGGLELYVLNISQWLQRQGHDCLVVMSPGSLISQRLSEHSLKSACLRPRFRPWPLIAAKRLAHFLDQHQCDILHVHWTNDLLLAVLAKCLSRSKPKLVFIRHMALTRHKRDFYHRFIYRNIDAYLVITKRLYAEAEQFLPVAKDRIHLLYHAVGKLEQGGPSHCEAFLAEKGVDKGRFRILLPGRIEHGKGQHILLEAVHQLQQRGVPVEVALMGHIMDQAYFDHLQQQIQDWGLREHFHYLGFIDKPTTIFNCFDVIVLTTYAETFGLVLIEGMKCGIPVIGSNAGGVPEIIEHGKTGLLYEPGDSTALAACLEQLESDPELCKKLALAGQQFADEVFSEQQHYAKLMQIFTNLTVHSLP